MSLRVEVGTTWGKIHGYIPEGPLVALRHALSYEVPNLHFRRQNNRWAKERKFLLTEKRHEFRTGLLKRLCENLETQGLDYEIDDRREISDPSQFMPHRFLEDADGFRDYQLEAIDAAVNERYGILRIATGGGKTRVMSGIMARLERPTVVLVHRLDLMHQVYDVTRDLMLYPELVGIVGGGIYQPGVITVCTIQTICAALGIAYESVDEDDRDGGVVPRGAKAHAQEITQLLHRAAVVILDEAHHAPARTILEVMEKCDTASWRIGLTATDFRDDKADILIEAAMGPRIYNASLSDLVAWGYLVPAEVRMSPMAVPAVRCDSDNWQTLYRHYYTENDAFHKQVREDARGFYERGRHTLILVTHVKHGHNLETLIRREGMSCVFLSGKDTATKRAEVMEDVRASRVRVLIGTSIADEGLDMPILDSLILAGGGTSKVKVYQRLGRTLRPYPGKINAEVIDYRCRDHGTLKEKAGRRVGVYKSEPCFHFSEVRE